MYEKKENLSLERAKELYLATLDALVGVDGGLFADQDDDWWEDVRKACEAVLAAPNDVEASKAILWWYEGQGDESATRDAREFAHALRSIATGRKPLPRIDRPQHEIETGFRRYEAIRKLHAHAFAALYEANIRGRNFDQMVDRLVVGERWEDVAK